jgi:hypothetical protein
MELIIETKVLLSHCAHFLCVSTNVRSVGKSHALTLLQLCIRTISERHYTPSIYLFILLYCQCHWITCKLFLAIRID